MSCRCKECLPVVPEMGVHATPQERKSAPTCTADNPCIDPGSVECACPTETILQEAQRLVHGDRGASYGHPIIDYECTGRIWGALLGIPDIDPRICCLMMIGVKLSRESRKHKRDNLVDTSGYAECADMIAQKQGL